MAHNNNIMCRYFASGCCNREDCSFLHDRTARPDNVCRYYLLGQCFYGDSCRYDHVSSERQRNLPYPSGSSVASKPRHSAIPKPRFQPTVSTKNGDGDEKTQQPEEHRLPPSSYAQAVDRSSSGAFSGTVYTAQRLTTKPIKQMKEFCQYALVGVCPIGEECDFFHGNICDVCNCQILDPDDETQRTRHEKLCVEAMERDMEFSFAVQRSSEKVCSICMENVLDKNEAQKQRFGILENCGHTFCFECIMNWRKQSKETLDQTTIRSCPECRIHSDYVVPSKLWPETKDDRDRVIKDYKSAMGKKPCRHFDHGRGKCPFGGSCWFMHTLEDGTKVSLPVPKPRRRLLGADGLTTVHLDSYQLGDYFDFFDETDEEEDDEDVAYIHDHDFYDDEFMYEFDSEDEDEEDEEELTNGQPHLQINYAGMRAALELLELNRGTTTTVPTTSTTSTTSSMPTVSTVSTVGAEEQNVVEGPVEPSSTSPVSESD